MQLSSEYETAYHRVQLLPRVQNHHAMRADGDKQVFNTVPHDGRGSFVRDVDGGRPDQIVRGLTAVYLGHVWGYVRESQSFVQVTELQHQMHVELLQCIVLRVMPSRPLFAICDI